MQHVCGLLIVLIEILTHHTSEWRCWVKCAKTWVDGTMTSLDATLLWWVTVTLREVKRENCSRGEVSDQPKQTADESPTWPGVTREETCQKTGGVRVGGRQASKREKNENVQSGKKQKMLTLMLGFFRMNPRYQPAGTKQCLNLHLARCWIPDHDWPCMICCIPPTSWILFYYLHIYTLCNSFGY